MKLDAIPKMLSMIPSTIKGVTKDDLERIKEITRLTFPNVAQVSTQFLARLMNDKTPPFLIDVRSAKEYAVSHLRGAVNLRTAQEIKTFLKDRQECKAVLYCSVGFRSSRLVNVLFGKSICDLENLEGSIFQWANEGRPVYRGPIQVRAVHPYGRRWAGLLNEDLASFG